MEFRTRSSTDTATESKEALLTTYERQDHAFDCPCQRKQAGSWMGIFPWICVLILSASLVLSIARPSHGRDTCDERTCYWRESEFDTARREIPAAFQNVQFEATLKYNESHRLYRPVTEPSYVGTPSAEIDAAWADILGVVQIFITPDEANSLDGNSWIDSETGLPMAIVTGFHDLHCLNMIRKARYPDFYPELGKQEGLEAHLDHCLDSLRLTLMCNADMTLIPLEWSENRNWIMPKFETVHTCRDYAALKQWSTERDAVDEAKFRLNAERLRAKIGLEQW